MAEIPDTHRVRKGPQTVVKPPEACAATNDFDLVCSFATEGRRLLMMYACCCVPFEGSRSLILLGVFFYGSEFCMCLPLRAS